tara:strand:+ start:397 stop:948 length:552 start_codon:yes stop_codon:yes gene_type:complete
MVCRPAIRIEILNKEEKMENTIIITNSHPHGFCFACDTVSNEQVFIPIHVAEGYTLKPGDKIKAMLVPNFADKSARGTPWQAVRLYSGKDVPINQVEVGDGDDDLTRSQVDSEIFKLIQFGGYYSTQELAQQAGLGEKAVGNSAMRLFSAGKIAKAEVYGSANEEQATFFLWAERADNFIEVS